MQAQRPVDMFNVRFIPSFDQQVLRLDHPYASPDGDTVTITRFLFYVSHVRVFSGGAGIAVNEECHLIDATDPSTWELALASTSPLDSITFLLGVDSATNAGGARGGDLDPTKGMYWAWNTGYVNLKLEGANSTCKATDGAFQFHLGGFLPPDQSAHWVSLSVDPPGPVAIVLHVDELLHRLLAAGPCRILSPGQKAVRASRIAASVLTMADAK